MGPRGECNPKAKSIQINPSKTKQKSLDFLGFIRPNRDFSMGYARKNKKIRLASQVVVQGVSRAFRLSFSSTLGGAARQSGEQKNHNACFWFWQENVAEDFPGLRIAARRQFDPC
jgi:hypothetical protein